MIEPFITLVVATALLLGSPGPAPLALAATGATFGRRKGTPFLIGVLVGLTVAIVGAVVGLSTLFAQFPYVKSIVQYAGAAYILFIAYKIATAPLEPNHSETSIPDFKDGFILNLLNPKAYVAFFALFSQFLLPFPDAFLSYFATGLTCLIVAVVVDIIWLVSGGFLKPIFAHPNRAPIARLSFAILMLISVGYSLFLS
ncbi:MAG: LysE family translocator [Gammaproteobacteria bacterium]|nr:LysE family translocator [Gammaproteobacteria bacterium]